MRLRNSRNKYNAKKTELDGYTFDSQIEAKRYTELRLLESAGEIIRLKVHPIFPIRISHKVVCRVELDFCYYDIKYNKVIYEDVKGFYTQISKLKHKLFEAYYNEEVTIITDKKRRTNRNENISVKQSRVRRTYL